MQIKSYRYKSSEFQYITLGDTIQPITRMEPNGKGSTKAGLIYDVEVEETGGTKQFQTGRAMETMKPEESGIWDG